MPKKPPTAQFESQKAAFAASLAECGGQLEVYSVSHDRMDYLKETAIAGVATSQMILEAMLAWGVQAIADAERGFPAKCAKCEEFLRPARDGMGFVLVCTGAETPELGVAMGLCPTCAPDERTTRKLAIALVDRIFKRKPAIHMSTEVGHA